MDRLGREQFEAILVYAGPMFQVVNSLHVPSNPGEEKRGQATFNCLPQSVCHTMLRPCLAFLAATVSAMPITS